MENGEYLLLLTALITALTAETTKARNPIEDIELEGAHFHGGFALSSGIKRTGREDFLPILDL